MKEKDRKPIIGLTANIEEVRENVGYTLYASYPEAVKKAGGIPIVLTLGNDELAKKWVSLCDGILLTGGSDIHPHYYDDDPHPELGVTTPKLDASDMTVIREAVDKGIPIFGICRGSHLINVALGGTMIQDIESEVPDAVNHLDEGKREAVLSHPVQIQQESTLYKVVKTTDIEVNSFHHQAIGELGKGLRCVAKAPDGVVEGFESEDGKIMGTQFHPEEMRKFDGRMHELLVLFIEKCKETISK